MSQVALIRAIEEILADGYDPLAAIVDGEKNRGFRIVRPGDELWFRAIIEMVSNSRKGECKCFTTDD